MLTIVTQNKNLSFWNLQRKAFASLDLGSLAYHSRFYDERIIHHQPIRCDIHSVSFHCDDASQQSFALVFHHNDFIRQIAFCQTVKQNKIAILKCRTHILIVIPHQAE